MIVTRMTFEYPGTVRTGMSKARESAGKLLKNIAASKDCGEVVEKMSLSELLYFALVQESRGSFRTV